jgi:hypothetical protein
VLSAVADGATAWEKPSSVNQHIVTKNTVAAAAKGDNQKKRARLT